jgi:hypothetical protein
VRAPAVDEFGRRQREGDAREGVPDLQHRAGEGILI